MLYTYLKEKQKRMKFKTVLYLSTIFVLLMCFVSCASTTETMNGTYVQVVDDSVYYTFLSDGTYSTNDSNWDFPVDTSKGTYEIIDGQLILYASNDKSNNINMGYVYNDYLCSLWEGKLPEQYEVAILSCQLTEDLVLQYEFDSDKTYKYSVTSQGENVFEENGSYSINTNMVTCVNKGNETTFLQVDNDIFCIEYYKE